MSCRKDGSGNVVVVVVVVAIIPKMFFCTTRFFISIQSLFGATLAPYSLEDSVLMHSLCEPDATDSGRGDIRTPDKANDKFQVIFSVPQDFSSHVFRGGETRVPASWQTTNLTPGSVQSLGCSTH